MTDLHKKAERLAELPALRSWQESAKDKGPFQVPAYDEFALIVQEHEALSARLTEVEKGRDEARNALAAIRGDKT